MKLNIKIFSQKVCDLPPVTRNLQPATWDLHIRPAVDQPVVKGDNVHGDNLNFVWLKGNWSTKYSPSIGKRAQNIFHYSPSSQETILTNPNLAGDKASSETASKQKHRPLQLRSGSLLFGLAMVGELGDLFSHFPVHRRGQFDSILLDLRLAR